MTQKTDDSRSINDSSRCQHRFTNKMRCRLPIAANSVSFCTQHREPNVDRFAGTRTDEDTADFSAILSADAENFQTAKGIHCSLSDLYLLLSKARISPRRASILAYISSLQLRALPMAYKELGGDNGNDVQQIVLDIPRPYRGDDPPPVRPQHDSTKASAPPSASTSIPEPDPTKKPS
jgi:hypothetical protein